MVVENKEGYLSLGGSLWRSKGCQSNSRLPSLAYWCQEEGPPQYLTVKNSGDSNYPGGTEGCRKPIRPLKRPTHRLTHLQALTLGSSGGTMTEGCQEHMGSRLRCVASRSGLENSHHFPCVGSFSRKAWQVGTIFNVLSLPPTLTAKSESDLSSGAPPC